MFDDLPLEILFLVTQYLDTKDISHIISSSRRLHAVLQQSLYTEVSLAGWSGPSHEVVAFLYAVTLNPKLASYVRYLKIGPWDSGGGNMSDERITYDADHLRNLVWERDGYTEEEKFAWVKDLQHRETCDPWVALLIPQLKELRKLGINWDWEYGHIMRMFWKVSRQEEPVFPHLEEVYMKWHDEAESFFPSTCVNPIFYFPSVKKVGCEYVGGWFDSDGLDSDDDDPYGAHRGIIPPRTSNVTHLDLANTDAGNGKREWIQACKALKSCRIIHYTNMSHDNDYQPRKIYESLLLHKLTLESVWSEIVNRVGMESDNEWMGSFADFSTLKVLCVSLPNLVGLDRHGGPMKELREVLPCSLETLYIISYEHEYEGYKGTLMNFLAPETLEHFPKLAAIHVDSLEFSWKPETMNEHEGLKQRCQQAGIAFFLHPLDSWPDTDEKPSSWVFGPVNEARFLG